MASGSVQNASDDTDVQGKPFRLADKHDSIQHSCSKRSNGCKRRCRTDQPGKPDNHLLLLLHLGLGRPGRLDLHCLRKFNNRFPRCNFLQGCVNHRCKFSQKVCVIVLLLRNPNKNFLHESRYIMLRTTRLKHMVSPVDVEHGVDCLANRIQ